MIYSLMLRGVPSNIGVRRREPNARGPRRPPAGSRDSAPVGALGGRAPPEAEAFYSSKIKLEPLGSTQITKMDSNN